MREILSFFKSSSFKTKVVMTGLTTLALAVMLSTVWIVYLLVSLRMKMPETVENIAPVRAPAAVDFAYKYEIQKISIPLSDASGRKLSYAQFSLVFDCPSPEARKMMLLRRAQIKDSIFQVASGYYLKDFSTSTGFDSFKMALLENMGEYLKENSPRTVLIENWLMN